MVALKSLDFVNKFAATGHGNQATKLGLTKEVSRSQRDFESFLHRFACQTVGYLAVVYSLTGRVNYTKAVSWPGLYLSYRFGCRADAPDIAHIGIPLARDCFALAADTMHIICGRRVLARRNARSST
jgi:hypothetical protein